MFVLNAWCLLGRVPLYILMIIYIRGVCVVVHMQLRGTLCMSVISCEETYALYKNVDTLMESHDLPRTGSAKWQILSATRV